MRPGGGDVGEDAGPCEVERLLPAGRWHHGRAGATSRIGARRSVARS